jgi:CBS domain-containing protein
MTPNPKAVDPNETIEDCMFLLREFGFRHLLITDGKELKGLLSLRDILLAYAAEKEGGAERMAG